MGIALEQSKRFTFSSSYIIKPPAFSTLGFSHLEYCVRRCPGSRGMTVPSTGLVCSPPRSASSPRCQTPHGSPGTVCLGSGPPRGEWGFQSPTLPSVGFPGRERGPGPGSSDAAGPALSRQPKTSSGDPTAPSRGESTPDRGGHSAPGLQYLPSPTLRSAAPGLTGRTRRRGRDGAAAGGIPERRKGGSGAGSPRPWRG